MKRKKDSESILQAAKRVAVATELLMQLSALQSFREQGLIDAEQARDEIIVLVKQYVAETEKASELLNGFLDNHKNGHFG